MELIPHTTATQLANIYTSHVPKILEHLEQASELTRQLKQTYEAPDYAFRHLPTFGDDKIAEIRREAKRSAWGAIVERLNIRRFMSPEKSKELDYALTFDKHRSGNDPIDEFPEISAENILRVVGGYSLSIYDFLDESIQHCWKYWIPQRDEYATNKERWKVSKKIIHTGVMRRWDKWDSRHQIRYDEVSEVTTLDNVFHLLDGKGFVSGSVGPLASAIEMSKNGVGSTEYFSFRCFKNGNIHIKILRDDLLDLFNQIGCGNGSTSLPNPVDVRSFAWASSVFEGHNRPRSSPDFFETPAAVSKAMIKVAKEHLGPLRDRMILEPSAGNGALARAFADEGAVVYAVEKDLDRSKSLEKCWDIRGGCTHADFLDLKPHAFADLVAMNPPFSSGQDMWHVYHAAKWLRRGGILIAVMSPHWTFASDQASKDFRAWALSLGASWSPLPAGSFMPSTAVSTGLFVVCRSKDLPKDETQTVSVSHILKGITHEEKANPDCQ